MLNNRLIFEKYWSRKGRLVEYWDWNETSQRYSNHVGQELWEAWQSAQECVGTTELKTLRRVDAHLGAIEHEHH